MDATTKRVLKVAVDEGKIARDQNEQMEAIKQYLSDGVYPAGFSKNQKRVLRKALGKGQYELDDGKLYYNTHVGEANCHLNKRLLVVTDKKEKMRLLWHCHTAGLSAHVGVNATQEKLAMTHYWRGMKEDVRRYYESCDRCKCRTKRTITPRAPKPAKVLGPWHMVVMGLVGPLKLTPRGNQYILTLTDYFTKFVDFNAIPAKSGEAVAKALETFFLRWGAPGKLLSDQGREFVSQINQALADRFKVKTMVTSACRSQGNGLGQRTNQTLMDRLKRLTNDQQDDWDTLLDHVAFSMRSQKQKSTKFTPFFLMFRREVRMPHHMEQEEETQVNLDELEKAVTEAAVATLLESTENGIKTVDEQVLKNLQMAKMKQKEECVRRKMKSVGASDLTPQVQRTNMHNAAWKDGQFCASWLGPYPGRSADVGQEDQFELCVGSCSSGATEGSAVPGGDSQTRAADTAAPPVCVSVSAPEAADPDTSSTQDSLASMVTADSVLSSVTVAADPVSHLSKKTTKLNRKVAAPSSCSGHGANALSFISGQFAPSKWNRTEELSAV